MTVLYRTAALAIALLASIAQSPTASAQVAAPPTAQFKMPTPPDPVLSLPDDVEGLLDLTYLQRSGYRPLTLDLYRKRGGSARRPVVVYVHGGSLLAGDGRMATPPAQAGMHGFSAMLAARGYAVANVNYRLAGEALLPAAVLDIKAAIRWLRAHADKYGLDPDRFAVFGDSAGGGVAALIGASCGSERFAEKLPTASGGPDLSRYSDCVSAAVDWFGVIDMDRLDSMAAETKEVKPKLIHNDPNSSQSRALGCVLGSTCSAETVQMYNPIAYLDRGKRGVSYLIVHGTHDTAVSYKQSQLFYDALKARGIPAQLQLVPGVDHYFTGAKEADIAAVTDRFLAFLNETIGSQASR